MQQNAREYEPWRPALSAQLLFAALFSCLWIASSGADSRASSNIEELLGEDMQGIDASTSGVLWREVTGFVEFAPRLYLNDRNGFHHDSQLQLRGELEIDFLLTDMIHAYVRPRFLSDLGDEELYRFEPFEAYLEYVHEKWDLRIGQFVENWGITDTFNPVDVLNQRDLSTSLLDPDRLGEFGVRSQRHWLGNSLVSQPSFAFYFLPAFNPTKFATGHQRLSLSSESREFDVAGGVEPSGREEFFYALRFQGTVNSSPMNADMQWVFAKGPTRSPLLWSSDMSTAVPLYYGNRLLGMGIRAVPNASSMGDFMAGFTFKLEFAANAAYGFNHSPAQAPNDYLAYVIGLDRDMYAVVNSTDHLTLTLEFAGESGQGAGSSARYPRPFSRDLIARAFWQAGNFSRLSLELRVLHDLTNRESVVESRVITSLIHIHSDLKLEFSALYLRPSKDGRAHFSQLVDNTSLVMALRYDF